MLTKSHMASQGHNELRLAVRYCPTRATNIHTYTMYWRGFLSGEDCLFIQLSLRNTLRPRQNGRHFADDIFKCIFLNENVWIPIEISVKFVPKGPINNIPALVPGLGSNTFYQIQIQIQIQKFGFFKYKYKYKYFVQHWFKYKYKYKYIDSNTNTNTFNQIYLPKLFRSKIGQFYESQDICSWPVPVSLCLGDTWR